MTGAILAANVTAGRLSSRVGAERVMLIGALATLAGSAGLLKTDVHTGLGPVLVDQALLGAGLGLLVPPMTSMLLASAGRSRSGVASGTLTTLRQSGSMIGVALFGSLSAGNGFYPGLHVAAAISLAVLLLSAFLTRLTGATASERACME